METKKRSKKVASKQLELDFESNFSTKNPRSTATLIDFNLAKSKFRIDPVKRKKRTVEIKEIVESLISRYK